MNILIIGSGGREHALAWKIRQSPRAGKIFIAPGNAGTAAVGVNVDLDINIHKDILSFCVENKIDLVVIGPDAVLASGLSDFLAKNGLKIFGPTKAAAEIEWSKAYAKKLMKKIGIQTAEYKEFKNVGNAKKYLVRQKFPLVIKASGLALGKGVRIAADISEAEKFINEIMVDKVFGKAGDKIIIEEYLEGSEISIHAFCDGETALLFPAAQDHKRIFDGDNGPNTGGMGVVAPVPWVKKELLDEVKNRIIEPLLKQLKKEGRRYVGLLFPGLIITKEGPKVLEFNARFGDPETQVYTMLLKSDLLEIILACLEGKLKEIKLKWENGFACCVILASSGYPESSKTGFEIKGTEKFEQTENITLFHSGTKKRNGKILTNGGRVLGVTAKGKTLKVAVRKAYGVVSRIKFRGMQYRRDIGKKSLNA